MTYRTRTCSDGEPLFFLHAAALAAFLVAVNPAMPLMAQGLDDEETIDSIVGSNVETEQQGAADDSARIVSAIENAQDSAERVRKAFNMSDLKIVFLPDIGEASSELDAAIEKNQDAIETLRQSIEGSALFYHAIDSRGILLRDIFALEFGDDGDATIFVAGEDPNG
jgi:hypothetical protein